MKSKEVKLFPVVGTKRDFMKKEVFEWKLERCEDPAE